MRKMMMKLIQNQKMRVMMMMMRMTRPVCGKRGNKVEIKGSGDYDKCQEIMTPLAVAMRSSVTKPEFDFDTNHFIGVSEYWDTAHYGFDLGGRFDHQKLQERVRAYCNSDWDSIAAVKKKKMVHTVI